MSLSASERLILHASLIDGVGALTLRTIFERKSSSIEWTDLYRFSVNDFCEQFSVSPRISRLLVDGLADAKCLDEETELIDRHHVKVLTCLSEFYPSSLSTIVGPPAVLYYHGLLHCDQALAIVGSRKAGSYAQQVLVSIIPQLVLNNFTIVSGGARGADTMAHELALKARGSTIAVLGSGLLEPYPWENKKLFESIVAAGGAVLSIFSLRTKALAGNFPARNRIISGLSHGCLVVQAAQKSGARITAQYALDQGREVFAIPGSIGDELSVGCHELIQQGAKLVTNANDILIEFGFQRSTEMSPERVTPIDNVPASQPHLEVGKKINHSGQVREATQSLEKLLEDYAISDVVVGMKMLLQCQSAQYVDSLLEVNNIELVRAQQILFELMVAGLIDQDSAGRWVRLV